MSRGGVEQDQKPFFPLPAPRAVSRSDLPSDLVAFYSRNEGVGLGTDCHRSVRLCRLDEIRPIDGWHDLRRPAECPPGWERFRAIYVGVGQFGDAILYILNATSCPSGSILAIGWDVAGPGGEGPDVLGSSVLLARTFADWIRHLEQVGWVEYGLVPGSLADLPETQQQEVRRYFLSLNPGIGWAIPGNL